MAIDPRKLIEIGGEVVDSIGLIRKTAKLLPEVKPQKARRKRDFDPDRDKSRRKSGANLRLKTGIWLRFHYRTGYGKFQALETSDAANLMQALIEEGVNYQFADRNSPEALLMPSTIALPAADFACARWIQLPREKRYAVVLTDEIGNFVLSNYNVRMIDRRRVPKPQTMFDSIGLLLDKARASLGLEDTPKRRKDDWEHGNDRRKSGEASRLTRGIWIQFHRKTGYGISQVLKVPEGPNLIHAFVQEGDHYQFSDPSDPEILLPPSAIAPLAVDFACARWKQLPAQKRQAFILTDEVANFVLSNYNVRMTDRRRESRQRAMAG